MRVPQFFTIVRHIEVKHRGLTDEESSAQKLNQGLIRKRAE
jgi:hypothetical protein